MDALAALQIAKRKKLEAITLREEESRIQKETMKVTNKGHQHQMNQMFGLPNPPKQVYAIGKDSSAAVWWLFDDNVDDILGWEICRYRKDHTKPDDSTWFFKGYNQYPSLPRLQMIIEELSNDREYRFTIKSINSKGPSVESEPSNIVMVEAQLPVSWYRFFDDYQKKYYYASIRTNRSSWTRPEVDPLYISDDILVNFTTKEIKYLQSLYEEDYQHFNCIEIPQFIDLLSEIGETNYNRRQVSQLFQAYNQQDPLRIKTWREFMDIINHIKQQRKDKASFFASNANHQVTTTLSFNLFSFLYHFFDRVITRNQLKSILPPNRDKLGDWTIEYNTFAKKQYYRNLKTNECSWIMPHEVKYYLPKPLYSKLQTIFTFEDIQEFQQFFALLYIDQSGDLSPEEIRTLLNTMGIRIDEKHFTKLIDLIDSNKNGRIEFDEFCYMMYTIRQQELIRAGGNGSGMGKSMKLIADANTAGASTFFQDDDQFHGNLNFQNMQNAGSKNTNSENEIIESE